MLDRGRGRPFKEKVLVQGTTPEKTRWVPEKSFTYSRSLPQLIFTPWSLLRLESVTQMWSRGLIEPLPGPYMCAWLVNNNGVWVHAVACSFHDEEYGVNVTLSTWHIMCTSQMLVPFSAAIPTERGSLQKHRVFRSLSYFTEWASSCCWRINVDCSMMPSTRVPGLYH